MYSQQAHLPHRNMPEPNHGYGAYQNMPDQSLGYSGQQSVYGQSGFAFKKRFQRVDWKKIASVDVDAVSRNLDFNALQDNIMNVTFCNIESEIDMRMVEPNLVKLFRIAQLTIEYLLHSQDYLSNLVDVLEGKLQKSLTEQEANQKSQSAIKEQLSEVKRESHKRKKMLLAQQQIIQAGANSYNKCQYCSKAFMNMSFLQSHIQRRHSEYLSAGGPQAHIENMGQVSSAPAPTTATVPPPQPQTIVVQSQPSDTAAKEEFEQQLREIKERLEFTESQLVEERNARNSLLEKEKKKDERRERQDRDELKRWKEEQQKQQKKEMSDFQETLLREMNELNDKYQASQQMLEAVTRKQAQHSNLGGLQDELENQQELLERQREEAAMLNEQLREQMEQRMQQELQQQEKKWNKKLENERRKQKQAQPVAQETTATTSAETDTQVMEIHAESEEEDESETPRDVTQPEVPLQQAAEVAQAPVVTTTSGVGDMYDDSEDETTRTETKPVTSLAHDSERSPAPRDRDEDSRFDNEDLDNSTEFDGTSTFTTTRGTMSMGQFGAGTLSMTEPPSERLLQEMRKNPNILKLLKRELIGILENELINRGVPKDATGISDAVYNSKIELLKNERIQVAKKYRNIYDIRQQYLDTVEKQARDILKARTEQTSRDKKPASSSAPSRPTSAPATRPQPSAPPLTPGDDKPSKKAAKNYAPVPAPRSTSPPGKADLGHIIDSHMRSSMATTAGSSTWDDDEVNDEVTRSDDEEEDDSEDDLDDDDDVSDDLEGRDDVNDGRHHVSTGSPASNLKAPKVGQYTRPAQSTEAPKPKPIKNTRFADEEENGDSDSNWDDLSDMDTLEPTLPGRQSRSSGNTYTSPPKGAKVAELSRSIELQMSGRGKKPVGGVSVIGDQNKRRPSVTSKTQAEEEDDSFPSVSSVDDEEKHGAGKLSHGRATPLSRNSMADTEYSTNTYGTSVWGSSRGGGSAAAPAHNHHNTSSKTFAESDVWDSDPLEDD